MINTQNLAIQYLATYGRAPRWMTWIWRLIKTLLQNVIQQVLREALSMTLGRSVGQPAVRKENKLLIRWTSMVGELTFVWKS